MTSVLYFIFDTQSKNWSTRDQESLEKVFISEVKQPVHRRDLQERVLSLEM